MQHHTVSRAVASRKGSGTSKRERRAIVCPKFSFVGKLSENHFLTENFRPAVQKLRLKKPYWGKIQGQKCHFKHSLSSLSENCQVLPAALTTPLISCGCCVYSLLFCLRWKPAASRPNTLNFGQSGASWVKKDVEQD